MRRENETMKLVHDRERAQVKPNTHHQPREYMRRQRTLRVDEQLWLY